MMKVEIISIGNGVTMVTELLIMHALVHVSSLYLVVGSTLLGGIINVSEDMQCDCAFLPFG